MTSPALVHTIQSINPATGEVLAELPAAGGAEVDAAVAAARRAQPGWAATPVAERARIVAGFRDLLFAQRLEVAELITRENGKPLTESLITEVMVTLDTANYFASQAEKLLRPERVPNSSLAMKSRRGKLHFEPLGVIGIISPWNYPLSTPATQVIPALVAGNAVVLKPSELTPLAALKLAEIFVAAGLPNGVLQVIVGDGATGGNLIASGINKIVFTGSVATGRKVAQAAALRLIPCVLELGGKDPMIVLDDADPDVAASGALWGGLMNCGQTCISVERIYVQRRALDPFLTALIEKCSRLKVGSGFDADVEIGPMIRERQVRIVEGQVEDAVANGARVMAGGRRSDAGPLFYEPTILTCVNHRMRIMREETFGPVLPVMPVGSDDEAVALANDSEFGLSASVWTSNVEHGRRVAARLEAGSVMINDAVSYYGNCDAPHGGVKSSGLGRTHGRHGLREMVSIKYVDEDLLGQRPKPWWFGYDSKQLAGADSMLQALFAPLGKRMRAMPGTVRALKQKKL
jgi:succinate-semialdehyde dehydrogenase/glutarate-semialdehyde dehydrogenase